MDAFPFMNARRAAKVALPLYKDVKMKDGIPVFIRGEPVMASGKEAVLSYAVRALKTRRGRYPYFSRKYGSDFEMFLGTGWSEDAKKAECIRGIRECLAESPYIETAENITIAFNDGVLHAALTLKTIYGEGEIYV